MLLIGYFSPAKCYYCFQHSALWQVWKFLYYFLSLDTTYPGTKEELKHVVIKVRRKSFGNEQAIYMAGEQTFKKSEKTEVEKQGLLLHQKHYDSGY